MFKISRFKDLPIGEDAVLPSGSTLRPPNSSDEADYVGRSPKLLRPP